MEPFRKDIDELINEFAEGGMTTLAEMKRVWLSRKFSYIYEARPSIKVGFFMQSLYAHCLGYMKPTRSLSYRLGGLYCLYCLHETQPFKPPFRVYLCLRELSMIKGLVIDAKKENVGVVRVLVKSMMERNLFFYGAVDLEEGSVEERLNELTYAQNATVQRANKMILENSQIERYIHMDMEKELEVDLLKKMSSDYAKAKELAIKETEKVVDVQDIKHIAENQNLIGDKVEGTCQEWKTQKEMFYQQTGLDRCPPEMSDQHQVETEGFGQQNGDASLDLVNSNEGLGGEGDGYAEDDDNFGDELEQQLLSLAESE